MAGELLEPSGAVQADAAHHPAHLEELQALQHARAAGRAHARDLQLTHQPGTYIYTYVERTVATYSRIS